MNNNQDNRRIAVFIILSLIFHFGWILTSRLNVISLPEQSGHNLVVRLEPVIHQRNDSDPSNKPNPVKNSTNNSITGNSERQDIKHKNKPLHLADVHILDKLRDKIHAQFIYPALARKKGWQGRVLLAFSINKLGQISHVRIKQSSGYEILDESAVSTLVKVGTIDIQQSSSMFALKHFELPIIYQIKRG